MARHRVPLLRPARAVNPYDGGVDHGVLQVGIQGQCPEHALNM